MIKEELLDKLLKKVKTIDKINDCNDNKKRVYLKPTKEDTIAFASLSLFLILNACCWAIFSDQHIAAIIGIVIFLQFLFEELLSFILKVYNSYVGYKEEEVLDFLLRIKNEITQEEYKEFYKYIEEKNLEYKEFYKYIEEKNLFKIGILDFLNIGYKENKESKEKEERIKKEKEHLLEVERERKEKEREIEKQKQEIKKQEAIFSKKKRLAKMYSEYSE